MRILHWLFILSLVLIIFLSSFSIMYFDKEFYFNQFEKNGGYERLGRENVNNNFNELMGYFQGNNELKTGFFTLNEKKHLGDVKGILDNAFGVFYLALGASFLILIYLLVEKKDISYDFIFSGVITLCIVLIAAAIALFNFSWLFTEFHLFSFDNELWLLPGNSNLIMMFPREFFFAIFLRILLITAGFSLVFIALGYSLKRNYSAFMRRFI
ncbi:MAG TPA: DUF1461 domain-containing protein [Candidatus Nanoarchaeia archaeon]|nr:DUF1461 domain-containing protein [Candidatus Nanoarchaeia archaeon]